jgi:uncharacterized protein
VPVWAGVIPLSTHVGTPIPDPRLMAGMSLPAHVTDYLKP